MVLYVYIENSSELVPPHHPLNHTPGLARPCIHPHYSFVLALSTVLLPSSHQVVVDLKLASSRVAQERFVENLLDEFGN